MSRLEEKIAMVHLKLIRLTGAHILDYGDGPEAGAQGQSPCC
jgi:hypothetical protein